MDFLIALAFIALPSLVIIGVYLAISEMKQKDETILMWQKAYADLTIENELLKLGVMK